MFETCFEVLKNLEQGLLKDLMLLSLDFQGPQQNLVPEEV